MVARLQQRVEDLRQELALATGEERTDELTDDEKSRYKYMYMYKCTIFLLFIFSWLYSSVRSSVVEFIESKEMSYLSFNPPDMRKIQLAFEILKVSK